MVGHLQCTSWSSYKVLGWTYSISHMILPLLCQQFLIILTMFEGLHSRENYEAGQSDSQNMSTLTAAQPYHTRTDSKPFSYIRTSGPNSRAPSRNLSRASSREVLGQPGLESPGLLRKIMGVAGTDSDAGSRPLSPAVTTNR